jgi:hypothetical protein
MKSIIFWDMTPCSALSFNRRFGRTYRLHLQGRRNRFGKTSKQAGGKPEDGGDMFLHNVGWNSNGLHGVISQKMILFNVQYTSHKYFVHLTGLVSDTCFLLQSTKQVDSSSDTRLVFRRRPVWMTLTILTNVFCGLPQTLQANVRIISQIRPWLPPPTSIPAL